MERLRGLHEFPEKAPIGSAREALNVEYRYGGVSRRRGTVNLGSIQTERFENRERVGLGMWEWNLNDGRTYHLVAWALSTAVDAGANKCWSCYLDIYNDITSSRVYRLSFGATAISFFHQDLGVEQDFDEMFSNFWGANPDGDRVLLDPLIEPVPGAGLLRNNNRGEIEFLWTEEAVQNKKWDGMAFTPYDAPELGLVQNVFVIAATAWDFGLAADQWDGASGVGLGMGEPNTLWALSLREEGDPGLPPFQLRPIYPIDREASAKNFADQHDPAGDLIDDYFRYHGNPGGDLRRALPGFYSYGVPSEISADDAGPYLGSATTDKLWTGYGSAEILGRRLALYRGRMVIEAVDKKYFVFDL